MKNKVAPPFRQAEFDLIFGQGASREGCILDLAIENSFVNKSGSWFSYGETRMGQGRDAAKAFLVDHPEIANDLDAKLRAKLMPVVMEPEAEVPALV